MSKTPYIGFDNATLEGLPLAAVGDLVQCPHCDDEHRLRDSKPPGLLFYECGDKVYLGAVGGRLITQHLSEHGPDVSGEVEL